MESINKYWYYYFDACEDVFGTSWPIHSIANLIANGMRIKQGRIWVGGLVGRAWGFSHTRLDLEGGLVGLGGLSHSIFVLILGVFLQNRHPLVSAPIVTASQLHRQLHISENRESKG